MMIQNTFFEQLFGLVMMAGFIYLGYSSFKHNPDMYSMENTNKSLWKMGILSLFLMAFVYFLVQMVGPGDSYSPQGPDSSTSDYQENRRDDMQSI